MKKTFDAVVDWLLFVAILLVILSGFALTHQYGVDKVLTGETANLLHYKLLLPTLILLILHLIQNMKIKF